MGSLTAGRETPRQQTAQTAMAPHEPAPGGPTADARSRATAAEADRSQRPGGVRAVPMSPHSHACTRTHARVEPAFGVGVRRTPSALGASGYWKNPWQ